MRQIRKIWHITDSQKGSVMLEFILVLPLYLLLIGGLMLSFELMMAKLHLQEANRNLAWLVGERYFFGVAEQDFKESLYQVVCHYFTNRNEMEEKIKENNVPLWSFGDKQDFWGLNVAEKDTERGKFNGITNWGLLTSGNMQLTMNRVSGAYVGPLGLTSVLYRNPDATDLYNKSYDLTRTKVPSSDEEITGDEFSPESYLVRRAENDTERTQKNQYVGKLFKIIAESWPCSTDASVESSEEVTLPTDGYTRQLYKYAQ